MLPQHPPSSPRTPSQNHPYVLPSILSHLFRDIQPSLSWLWIPLLPWCLLKLCEHSIAKTSPELSPARSAPFLPLSDPTAAPGLPFSSHGARKQARRPQTTSLPVSRHFFQGSSSMTMLNSSKISQNSWFPYQGIFLILSCWNFSSALRYLPLVSSQRHFPHKCPGLFSFCSQHPLLQDLLLFLKVISQI